MKKILIALMVCLMWVACNSEKRPEPIQPEGYSDLYAAYLSGLRYTSIKQDGSYTVIKMEDKSTVSLKISEAPVYDCRDAKPASLTTSESGEWMLGGRSLGIWKNESVSDAQAVPVYIYYTTESLTVRLHNGRGFTMDYVDPILIGSLPTIYLTTKGGKSITSKETYVDGTIRICDPDNRYSDVKLLEMNMQIRGRGNSTWGMPKKPYRIKLEKKASVFGIHEDKNWCLLANYADKSLIRNMVAMEISRICSMAWTPEMRSCEVYLNNKYIGVYTFCQHKEVKPHKVNLDIDSGDILFEVDEDQNEPVSWYTDHGTPLMFSDPSEPSKEQISFAKKYFDDLENALWRKDFETAYKSLEIESIINNYIIQELTMNVDGNFRKSSCLSLPKDGKLSMDFVWDFDLSLGNADYYGTPPGVGPSGWWVKTHARWYVQLFKDPEFVSALKARWNALYPTLKSSIPQYIEFQTQIIGTENIDKNFSVWSFTDNGWWNASRRITNYPDEINNLKYFYATRLEWLNTSISAL